MAGNDINIRIGAKLDGLQRDIKKAQGSLTRFADFAESTGRDLSTRLSLPILGVGAAAVTSFAKFEKLELSLKALAEEARMMLDEGVVTTPAEIDLCMLMGAGWPMHLGGILPYLDREGISEAVTGKRFHEKGVASLP